MKAGGPAQEVGEATADVSADSGALGGVPILGALLDKGNVQVLVHGELQDVHEAEDIGGSTRRVLYISATAAAALIAIVIVVAAVNGCVNKRTSWGRLGRERARVVCW